MTSATQHVQPYRVGLKRLSVGRRSVAGGSSGQDSPEALA